MEQPATKHALRPCVTQSEGAHYVQIDLVAISSQEGRFKSLGTLRWLALDANLCLLTATALAHSREPTRTGVDGFLTLWLLAYTPLPIVLVCRHDQRRGFMRLGFLMKDMLKYSLMICHCDIAMVTELTDIVGL